ncbi:MAG TPA: hypothetical protein VIK51_23440 [Vicinamibacteria bacterium]
MVALREFLRAAVAIAVALVAAMAAFTIGAGGHRLAGGRGPDSGRVRRHRWA